MTALARRWDGVLPPILGGLCLIAAFGIAEALLRTGVLNRYIIPLPSEVVTSFGRIIREEHIPSRFLLTAGECLAAGLLVALVGGAVGVLLHKISVLRRATETWVAAFAAAPIVLAYPLFLVIFGRSATTIVVIGFIAGLPAMILKTVEGLGATRPVLIDVGRSFNLTARQQFWKIMLPAALPTLFVGLRLALIFCLINIVGVEFLINYGGLGQLINDLAERYDLAGTYGAICFVILVSVCFFWSLEKVERWLRPAD